MINQSKLCEEETSDSLNLMTFAIFGLRMRKFETHPSAKFPFSNIQLKESSSFQYQITASYDVISKVFPRNGSMKSVEFQPIIRKKKVLILMYF